MLRLPQLVNGQKQPVTTTTFRGYNHNEIIRDGEMYDMQNLSGDMYPLMTLRKKRSWTSFAEENSAPQLTGIDGRDQLTLIVGTKVYWNLLEVANLTVSDNPADCPKKIVNFGAYVLIFPDKVYFNTINLSDVGTIDRLFSIASSSVSLQMCRADGTNYDMSQIDVNPTAPASPTNGKLWIDTSGDNDVLRQWTSSTEEWIEVATTFVKIGATGIGTGLQYYDAITISGLTAASGASAKLKAQVKALNGSKIMEQGGTDYIVVSGFLTQAIAAGSLATATVRADRKIPDMDYIVQSNNRLWGCKYGLVSGQVVNEIRCSALGDFRNWEKFRGNSQDSYVASVGTDGPFTGAAVQKGYPVFFKENCVHQVWGSAPSSFQIKATVCRGVQLGSDRSVCVVNEQVYYKSRTDVMMFDGSLPVSVSSQLGDILYSNARAGALGNKYYISMKDKQDAWTLLTYDTENGVWYKEDGFRALGFGRVDDELFAICEDDNKLWAMRGTMGTAEDDLDWMAQFGLFGTDYVGKKYLSRFDIRMYLPETAVAKMWIMYDSDGLWRERGEIRGTKLRSFVLPVVPRRCDHLKVKLTGSGDMRIYSISRILEGASDG